MKPVNPYTRLLNEIKDFCFKLKTRKVRPAFFIKRNSLKTNTYTLEDVYQRARAADDIGYEMIVIADDDGLRFKYREKLPRIPIYWEL